LPNERFSSLVEDLAGIDHAEVKMGQLVYTAPSPPPALLKKTSKKLDHRIQLTANLVGIKIG
jgi:hypothetical protein